VKPVLFAALVHAIVHLRPENPPAAATGYVYTVNGVLPIAPPPRDPRTDAVLVLEPRQEQPAPAASADSPVLVRVVGARVVPEIVLAMPGTQVIFRNDERRPVTLYCRQAAELFPSTPLPPGARLAVTPPRPGQFELRSVEYPHLRATLLSPRGPASRVEFGKVGEVGVARLEVPDGQYLARLFFQHRFIAEKDVTVSTAPGPAAAPGSASSPAPGPTEFVLHADFMPADPPPVKAETP
jgi:hypothetical protein